MHSAILLVHPTFHLNGLVYLLGFNIYGGMLLSFRNGRYVVIRVEARV